VVGVINKTKATCPGVSNYLLVGFATNFFTGSIVRDNSVIGLPEGNPIMRYRSIDCSGSKDGNQCAHCQKLMHFLSVCKNHHFVNVNLGPYTPIQMAAMKEAKASATPQLSGNVDPECKSLIDKMIRLLNGRRLSPKSFLFLLIQTQVDNLEKVCGEVHFSSRPPKFQNPAFLLGKCKTVEISTSVYPLGQFFNVFRRKGDGFLA